MYRKYEEHIHAFVLLPKKIPSLKSQSASEATSDLMADIIQKNVLAHYLLSRSIDDDKGPFKDFHK